VVTLQRKENHIPFYEKKDKRFLKKINLSRLLLSSPQILSSMLTTVLFVSSGEIFLILLVILIFFGADKIPEFTRMMGKGAREFRKATDDIKREFSENSSGVFNEIRSIQHDLTESLTKEIVDPVQETVSQTKKSIEETVSETEKSIEETVSETKNSFEETVSETKKSFEETVSETKKTFEDYQDQYNKDFYYNYHNDTGSYGNEYRDEAQKTLSESKIENVSDISEISQTFAGNETEPVLEISKIKPKTRSTKPKRQTAKRSTKLNTKPETQNP